MHVHVFGELGRPVVLALHGTPTSAASFGALLEGLAEAGWRVLAPDLPGLGASVAQTPRSVEAVHEALVELLRREAVTRVALLGHSFGCWRAFDLALDARLSVRALVALAPLVRVDAAVRRAHLEAAAALRAGTLSHGAVVERWLSARSLQQQPGLRETMLDWLRALDPEHAAQDLELTARARDLSGALPALTMPAYLRVGGADRATPPRWAHAIAAALPDVLVDVVDGVGHFPQLEDADATCDGVRAFLERASGHR